MNKLTDSTSDSDSNSSASWIFIDASVSENQSEVNKYYLNCSSEPVQELTEKCLNSAGSEVETDSDGISVISESDSNKQMLYIDDQGNVSEEVQKETIETLYNTTADFHNIIKPVNTESRNSFVGCLVFFGIVLALTLSLFVSDDELIGNGSSIDCEMEIEHNFYEYDDQFEVEMESFTKLPYIDNENHISKLQKENSKIFKEEKSFKCDKSYQEEISKSKHRNKKLHSTTNDKSNEKFDSKMKMHCDKNKERNYNEMKEKYKNQGYLKEIKNMHKQLRRLEECLSKKEKELYENKQQLKSLKTKINKELDVLRNLKKSKHKYKGGGKNTNTKRDISDSRQFNNSAKLNDSGRFNYTIRTDWYSNMYKERNKIRKQEQMASWVFDRAEMRKKKRNKAIWYFNWMTGREHLRFKKDIK